MKKLTFFLRKKQLVFQNQKGGLELKKENLKEKALEVCDKINNLFIISGTIDSETISILTYEFVYLRLISLREFKSLVVRNEIGDLVADLPGLGAGSFSFKEGDCLL